jgi:hypothetical protein
MTFQLKEFEKTEKSHGGFGDWKNAFKESAG